jgi:DNA-directed RNA polymerase subunit RPC12/RpoP
MSPSVDKKEKARWARILRVYGLTKEQYDTLDLGYCPICLRDWSATVLPVIDHDHVDKKVRGIVCRYCNHRRIGHHRDSDLVHRIGDYLKGPFNLLMPEQKKKRRKKKK